MRTSLRQQARQAANERMVAGDAGDRLAPSPLLEDIETAAELGMSRQQTEAVKRRIGRG
ncbi:hypothetical protein [Effusibacillus pohliae]|uniref:hypothetical protein n=1 Tax=Effusibacillus pohliae TaxID=232270 RepID=UPI00035C1574|nr:hypothetical protein [Effusibacillus pohliae]